MTVFKWVGSKRTVAAQIQAHLPRTFNTYIEPCCGSAAVFWSLPRDRQRRAILNDINANIVNTYKLIRDHHARISSSLSTLREQYIACMTSGKHVLRALYATQCDVFNRWASASPRPRGIAKRLAACAAFIFVNQCAWGSVYRENKRGQFNVPFGPPQNNIAGVPVRLQELAQEVFPKLSELLRKNDVRLTCESVFDVLKAARPHDMVFIDPPYAPHRPGSFTQYSATGFSWVDHVRLCDAVKVMTGRDIYVMLTYADTPDIRRLYKGFTIKQLMYTTTKRKDIMIMNYDAAD